MCGRFTIALEPAEFMEELDLGDLPADFVPRYNVAPVQPAAVIRDFSSRRVEWMRWGLIPSWAKDPAIGARMINARSETLLEKPSFRDAFLKRRCLILADGFYEWQKNPGKQPSSPHYFFLKNHRAFFFAGLWEQWQPTTGDRLTTFTIITSAPNELISPIHERMPVILDSQNCWTWLNPSTSPATLQSLFQPYTAEKMAEYPVSTLVNQPSLETPELIKKNITCMSYFSGSEDLF